MKLRHVFAWLAGFVVLFSIFMSAVDSGHTGWATVIFFVAFFVLEPPFFRLKKRAFEIGYTGKMNPGPEELAKAEKAEKWANRFEILHNLSEWFK